MDYPELGKSLAPFAADEVRTLNNNQKRGIVVACKNDPTHRLNAFDHGWVCPTCDYRTNWAPLDATKKIV